MPNRSSPNTPGRFRFVVMSALWVTGMFLFFDRVNISLAVPHIKQDLGLTGVQTGMILSVFFWGYVLGQVAGGIAGTPGGPKLSRGFAGRVRFRQRR